ncbi:MAG TPA: type II toxin-antitoxin system RelE/ParE family toxin [Candidatus Acidoferrum sp.]|nr:type II toxin-antitoxin system RelE/ParE family toxin [Candidatus Acidoferrum sp.]
MGYYVAKPAVDDDLMHHAEWIALDNPEAARRFLDAAFRSFEFLAKSPEAGPRARLKHARLRDVRFWVLPPPFNRWLVFYRLESQHIVILRVLHNAQDWRERADKML